MLSAPLGDVYPNHNHLTFHKSKKRCNPLNLLRKIKPRNKKRQKLQTMITFILQMIIRGAALVSSSSASLIFMSQQFLVSSETLRARLLLSYITIYSFTSRFRDLSAMPQVKKGFQTLILISNKSCKAHSKSCNFFYNLKS